MYQTHPACQFSMVFGLTLAVIMGSLALKMRFETLGMGFFLFWDSSISVNDMTYHDIPIMIAE